MKDSPSSKVINLCQNFFLRLSIAMDCKLAEGYVMMLEIYKLKSENDKKKCLNSDFHLRL